MTFLGIENAIKAQLEQFPEDEIVDQDDRLVKGWMTVEIRDRDGEKIPITEVVGPILKQIIEQGQFPITDSHSNRIIGRVLTFEKRHNPVWDADGLYATYLINQGNAVADHVWKEIREGKRKGLSFGGFALKSQHTIDEITKDPTLLLKDLGAFEVSSVYDMANQGSENTHVNYFAKGDSRGYSIINKLPLGFTVEDMEKLQKTMDEMNSPWAICAAALGTNSGEKFERCVMHVKDRLGIEKTFHEMLLEEAEKSVAKIAEYRSSLYARFKQTPSQRLIMANETDKDSKVFGLVKTLADSHLELAKKVDDIAKMVAAVKAEQVPEAPEGEKPEEEKKPEEAAKQSAESAGSETPTAGDPVQLPKPVAEEALDGPKPEEDAIAIAEKGLVELKKTMASIEKRLEVAKTGSTPRPIRKSLSDVSREAEKASSPIDEIFSSVQKGRNVVRDIGRKALQGRTE